MEYQIPLSVSMDRNSALMNLQNSLGSGNSNTLRFHQDTPRAIVKQNKLAKRLIKRAIKSNSDPYLALLDFRNTPTQGMGTSPVQRLMNRGTKTLLPTKGSLLVPVIQDPKEQGKKIVWLKEREGQYYNHGTKNLQSLHVEDTVRIAPPWGEGGSRTKE